MNRLAAMLPGLLTAGLLFSPLRAMALDIERDAPFRITAKNVELDPKSGNVIYQGNVVLVQGSLRILADRIEARARQGRPEVLLGHGSPLHITAKPNETAEPITLRAKRLEYRRATDHLTLLDQIELARNGMTLAAQRLEYRRADSEIDILGKVVLRRGSDEFRAPSMHIDLKENLVTAGAPLGAGARERVTAVLQPRKEKP